MLADHAKQIKIIGPTLLSVAKSFNVYEFLSVEYKITVFTRYCTNKLAYGDAVYRHSVIFYHGIFKCVTDLNMNA
jgi:hypothetical protein